MSKNREDSMLDIKFSLADLKLQVDKHNAETDAANALSGDSRSAPAHCERGVTQSSAAAPLNATSNHAAGGQSAGATC